MLKVKQRPSQKDLSALASKVDQLRCECERYIEERAAELKREHPTLPIGVLRQQIVAGFRNCPCATILNLEFRENQQ